MRGDIHTLLCALPSGAVPMVVYDAAAPRLPRLRPNASRGKNTFLSIFCARKSFISSDILSLHHTAGFTFISSQTDC